MMRQIFTIGTCLLRGGGSSRSFWKPMDEGCFCHDLHPDSIHCFIFGGVVRSELVR
jgi:hypothetical protein